MAFKHGRHARVYANGYNLTGYLKAITVPKTADVGEASVFGLTSKTYVPGMADATLSADGVFDGASDAVDQILEAALGASTNSIWTWFPQGDDAVGATGYGLAGIETGYEIQTPHSDVAALTASAQSVVGRERIISLHPLGSEAATGTGAAVNNGAATAAGGVAYLQVIDVDGTAPTLDVVIQHSSDDFAADIETLATMTQVSADHQVERVEVAGTVKASVRAIWTIGGADGPAATFNVAFGRK